MINRRDFLKIAGLGVVASAVAATASLRESPSLNIRRRSSSGWSGRSPAELRGNDKN